MHLISIYVISASYKRWEENALVHCMDLSGLLNVFCTYCTYFHVVLECTLHTRVNIKSFSLRTQV